MPRLASVGLVLGICASLVACGTPPEEGDPWVGQYDAMRVTSARDCTTGISLPGSPSSSMATIEIMRDEDGRLFMPALCPFRFDEPEPGHAELEPLECEAELADGTVIRAMIMDGFLDIDGDHLTGSYETRTTTPTDCVISVTMLDATRS